MISLQLELKCKFLNLYHWDYLVALDFLGSFQKFANLCGPPKRLRAARVAWCRCLPPERGAPEVSSLVHIMALSQQLTSFAARVFWIFTIILCESWSRSTQTCKSTIFVLISVEVGCLESLWTVEIPVHSGGKIEMLWNDNKWWVHWIESGFQLAEWNIWSVGLWSCARLGSVREWDITLGHEMYDFAALWCDHPGN